MPISNEEFFQRLRSNAEYGVKLMERKNADYAGAEDPFRNFRGSTMIGLNPGHAILLRMLDKMSRVGRLLDGSTAQVKDESVHDTLIDLMNYANILAVWIDEEMKENNGGASKSGA